MDLPPALRRAVDDALAGTPLAHLTRAAETLSRRYRAEIRDGTYHVGDELAARAYLATRLPATYAAVRAAMAHVAEAHMDFAPASLLDVGAGPGTVMWAAADCWPSVDDAVLVEGSPAARHFGEQFAEQSSVSRVTWRPENFLTVNSLPRADLVALSYVLDEIDVAVRGPLIDRLWAATTGVLLIVEPGRPAGWERILAARQRLISHGAHLVAPCPHARACPIVAPDWCHFVRRVARSRVHRQAKRGDVPWEDEKFIYVAASRAPIRPPAARVIAPPQQASGRVQLKLCRDDGTAGETMFSRRDGAAYKTARRTEWGDGLPTLTP